MDLNITKDTLEEEDLIPNASHLCWVYDNDDDKVAVMKPFVLSHLVQRHRCLLVLPKETVDEIFESMREDDFNVGPYVKSGQLAAMEPKDLFFAGGPFDVDVILHRMRSAWEAAISDGWERLAVVSDPSALLDKADERDWLALEFRVDFECLTQPCSMLCVYDARQASGSFITKVIKAHPVVGLGRGLARNPFYGRQAQETS